MEVKVAQTAGFCYGVKRAVDAVYSAVASGKRPIYTYGPIVHNETVVQELEEKGVGVIKDRAALEKMCADGTLKFAVVVIRAHGVGQKEYALLRDPALGIKLIDATCPYVRKIQELVRAHSALGEHIIVTGSPAHPEVQGILGQIETTATVIETPEQAEQIVFEKDQKLFLVSQTTFNMQKFEDIVAIFKKRRYDIRIINTICNATQRRQKEAAELSRECDAMLVIGGRHSSNTAKLYEICRSECGNTYFIQSLADLVGGFNNSVRCVGITAGASTPESIIEEVLNYVRNEF